MDNTADADLFLPVQVMGEIRAGMARAAGKNDPRKARIHEQGREAPPEDYGNRVGDFDAACAQVWGPLLSGEKKDPHPVDKQIAAIALIRNMTVVTRDGGGIASMGDLNIKVLNPFPTGPANAETMPIQRQQNARLRRSHDWLILSERNPMAVIDHIGGEAVPVDLMSFGGVREVCPKCQYSHLHLILRQATVRVAHLLCPDCESCFDANYASGASAPTISPLAGQSIAAA